MKLPSAVGEIQIVNDARHTFGSADNFRKYPLEEDFSSGYAPSSTHGVLLNGEPMAAFAAGPGTTGVHPHSAFLIDTKLYLAVSNRVVCLQLSPPTLLWSIEVDQATCFGIYYSTEHSALLSHGEMEVARFSDDGEILWSSGGADIFTEGFELRPEYVEVVDFDGRVYQLDYETGNSSAATLADTLERRPISR